MPYGRVSGFWHRAGEHAKPVGARKPALGYQTGTSGSTKATSSGRSGRAPLTGGIRYVFSEVGLAVAVAQVARSRQPSKNNGNIADLV